MAKMFCVLFGFVVCLFMCCDVSGVFPVMAHSNDAVLLRKKTINAVETTAKDAKKMGDEIVSGYTKIDSVLDILEALFKQLLKDIIVVDKKVDKIADNPEHYLSFAINDARSEIIEARVCMEKIKNITVNSVKGGGAAADKTGDFVQKATAAVMAALGSVNNVNWAKEEKELKVPAGALRDVWEKSKEDVEWQMEEANNAFERINEAIWETENTVKIVKHHINEEKMQKAYKEKKKSKTLMEKQKKMKKRKKRKRKMKNLKKTTTTMKKLKKI